MDELQAARQIIDECDREMAALFEKRMAAAREIALCKKARGLPVYVPEREKEVLERNVLLIRDPGIRAYYLQFMQHTMDVSKCYQMALISDAQDAGSGAGGSGNGTGGIPRPGE